MAFEKLHITDLHEYLATKILKYKKPLEIKIKDFTPDGFMKIDFDVSENMLDTESFDFDLQGCECSGLNEHDELSEYYGKTISTSSAYEFIEFLGASSAAGKLLINIEDGTWKIKLLDVNF